MESSRTQAKEKDKLMLKERALEKQGKYIDQLLSQFEEWWQWWHHLWHEIHDDMTIGKRQVVLEIRSWHVGLMFGQFSRGSCVYSLHVARHRLFQVGCCIAVDTSSDEEEADDEIEQEDESKKYEET